MLDPCLAGGGRKFVFGGMLESQSLCSEMDECLSVDKSLGLPGGGIVDPRGAGRPGGAIEDPRDAGRPGGGTVESREGGRLDDLGGGGMKESEREI